MMRQRLADVWLVATTVMDAFLMLGMVIKAQRVCDHLGCDGVLLALLLLIAFRLLVLLLQRHEIKPWQRVARLRHWVEGIGE